MDAETKDGSVKYREEADTFSLTAIYTGDKILITLKDYNDWIVYEKEYTEEDIGKQIHKKVELFDICYAFTPVANEDDQSTQENKVEKKEYTYYTFGKVIENKNGPAYKIQSNGKVTVYTNVLYFRTNKQTKQIFESVLKLNKVRTLQEIEIFTIKTDLQKKEFNQKVIKQIQNLKKENNAMKQIIKQLKQIQLKQTTKQFEQQKKQMRKIMEKQVQMLKNYIQTTTSTTTTKFQKKLNQLEQKMLKKQKKITKCKPTIVDSSSPYSSQFQISGTLIKMITNNNGSWYQILLNEVIPQNKIYTFKIKIIKTIGRNIMIGILDRKSGKNNQYSQGNNMAICYYLCNGQFYPTSYGCQGGGASQGQTLQVTIDLRKGSIQYKVAGNVRATLNNNNLLLSKDRQFVPYIEMLHVNDCIEWIDSEELQQ